MSRRLLIALIVLTFRSLFGQTPPPALPPLDAKASSDLDRTWRRIAARDPNLGARTVYEFLLTAVAHDWHPDRWQEIITLGEELHDTDAASPTYGNYRWYRRQPKPDDRNAVEFSMASASLAWVLYRDRLPPPAREQLTRAFDLAIEGMLRHKVDVSYTNIFLMRLANCILLGESLNRPDLVQRARGWFDEWFAYTRANGIHEYSSPTYYGTDLCDLGALANYSITREVRDQAVRALQLFWTDIAANWFAPYAGIAGAHSRDYGFLTGHGYLDQQLIRAHWLGDRAVPSEAHPAIDDLTFWQPPSDLRQLAEDPLPRVVGRRWGNQPWETATHYVGHDFSLGSAGAGYGAQDKVLTLTLSGGPQMPLVNFSLDYRRDPYGQSKIDTSGGHAKLTHLLPFVMSVQRDSEVLLLASYDPARGRNPAGGRAPIEYAGVSANFVLPNAASLADARRLLPPGERVPLDRHEPLFLRYGKTAAALLFVAARNDAGGDATIEVVRDGGKVPAGRLSAALADAAPRQRVWTAVWIRAKEGIAADADFDSFRSGFLQDRDRLVYRDEAHVLDITVPGMSGPLHLVADVEHERRLRIEGADPAAGSGVLTVNGRDVAAPLLADSGSKSPPSKGTKR